jgi:hypothetical protein
LLACLSLGGCAALLVATYRDFSEREAAKIAPVGALLIACFYIPTVVIAVGEPYSTRLEIRSLLSGKDFVPVVGLILGPFLLAATIVCAMRRLRFGIKSESST